MFESDFVMDSSDEDEDEFIEVNETPSTSNVPGTVAIARPISPCAAGDSIDSECKVFLPQTRGRAKVIETEVETGDGSFVKCIIAGSQRTARAAGPSLPSDDVQSLLPDIQSRCLKDMLSRQPPLELRKTNDKTQRANRPMRKNQGELTLRASYDGEDSEAGKEVTRKDAERVCGLRRICRSEDPSWSMSSFTSVARPPCSTIIERAIDQNALAASVVIRDGKQGGKHQTSRINTTGIHRAGNAQQYKCAMAKANVEDILRGQVADNVLIGTPMGMTQFLPWTAILLPPDEQRGVVLGSATMDCADMPTRLRKGGILEEAQRIAALELDPAVRLISSAFGRRSTDLDFLCSSCLNQSDAPFDPYWASIVVLNYVLSHPFGRGLVNLDQMNASIVETMEIYGRAEDTRRRNHEPRRASIIQSATSYKRKRAQVEDEEEALEDKERTPREAAIRGAAVGIEPERLLDYWTKLLVDKYSCVPIALVGQPSLTKIAAIDIFEEQAPGKNCVDDVQLQDVVTAHAEQISSSMRPILEPATQNAPRIVAASLIRSKSSAATPYAPSVSLGILAPTSDIEPTIAHAVSSPAIHSGVSPPFSSGQAILWCDAVTKISSRSNLPPGESGNSGSRHSEPTWGGEKATIPGIIGHHRSWLVMRTRLSTYPTDDISARSMVTEATNLLQSLTTGLSGLPGASSSSSAILGESTDFEHRVDPLIHPSPAQVIGTRLSHIGFKWLNKGRKGIRPARHLITPSVHTRALVNDTPRQNTNPFPLATIVSYEMGRLRDAQSEQIDASDSLSKSYSIAYCLALDRAMRLEDVISTFQRQDPTEGGAIALILLNVATAHAMHVATISESRSGDKSLTAMMSGRRVVAPDNTTETGLSWWHALIGGRGNLHPAMIGTPWEGTTGSWIDTGITPPGHDANNYNDQRLAANMCMSSATAGLLGKAQAAEHYVQVDESSCASRPQETQGVPWGFIRGVHKVTEEFERAMDHCRRLAGLDREDCDSANVKLDMTIMPVSAWAQQLMAATQPGTSDVASRYVTCGRADGAPHPSGRSIAADITDDDLATIDSNKLNTKTGRHNSYDNPYATATDELGGFKAMAALLGGYGRLCARPGASPTECMAALHACICAYVDAPAPQHASAILDRVHRDRDATPPPDTSPNPSFHLIAAHALVVLSAMYPSTYGNNQLVIDPGIGCAVTQCARAAHANKDRGIAISDMAIHPDNSNDPTSPVSWHLTASMVTKLRTWWSAFARNPTNPSTPDERCAWAYGVRDLCTLLLKFGSSQDITKADCKELNASLVRAVEAAWLVASSDGKIPPKEPNPMANLLHPTHVQRQHVEPVFVSRFEEPHARAGIVGLRKFQIVFLMNQLAGAHLLGDQTRASTGMVNVARLFGQLTYRGSSDPNVLKSDQKERTDRSTTLVTQGRCASAHGTFEARRIACAPQRLAWDTNTQLMTPLFVKLNRPRSLEWRQQGSIHFAKELERHLRRTAPRGLIPSEEVAAQKYFREAIESDASVKTHTMIREMAKAHGKKTA